jgi:outer membrane protein TolC
MGSQKRAADRQTDAQVQVATEDVRRAEQSVVLGVTQAFYNVLRAEHLRLVALDAVDRAEAHLRIAEAKYGAGTVAQYDVDRARADVASAKARLTQAEGAVRVALTVLARAMGLDPADRVQIQADLVPEFVRVDEEAARKLAGERPDIRRLNWQILASRAQIDSIELEDRPIISAFANTGYSIGGGFTDGVNYSIGLQATWPIQNGHGDEARIRQTEETIRSLELTRDDKVAEINTAIRTALEELATARASVDDAVSAVTNARVALQRVLLAYENNVGAWIDLRDARSGLVAAEETFVTTLFQYRLALADLEYSVGSRDLKGVATSDPSLQPSIPDIAGIPQPKGAPPIPESGGLTGRSVGRNGGAGTPSERNGGTR